MQAEAQIEVTEGVCGGKPRIVGRRITVQNIAVWHERLGHSVDEIATSYNLELSDVYAALAYYWSHRQTIDQSIQDDEEFVAKFRNLNRSPLQERLEQVRRDGAVDSPAS
jgi:uncharacterized protein (DUF433 family)